MIKQLNKSNINPNMFIIKQFNEKTFEITLNENVKEFEITLIEIDGEIKQTEYVYETTIKVVKANDLDELKGHIIGLKYNTHKEMSLINKGINDKTSAEYLEYRNFVEQVKAFVDGWVIDNE